MWALEAVCKCLHTRILVWLMALIEAHSLAEQHLPLLLTAFTVEEKQRDGAEPIISKLSQNQFAGCSCITAIDSHQHYLPPSSAQKQQQ